MSDLSAIILDILESVASPMRSDSLGRVLFCTGSVLGYGEPTTGEQIDAALEELIGSGKVERVRRRGDCQ